MPRGEPVSREGAREFYYPAYALLLLLLALMIKAAWLGDDAYILFRVCDNLLNGYGLRWNIEDRVQVFTHPLWMFVVTLFYGITHEIFITIIVLSIGLALAAAAERLGKSWSVQHWIFIHASLPRKRRSAYEGFKRMKMKKSPFAPNLYSYAVIV